MGRGRRLQLRRRLLRESDLPLSRGRARDLRDDADVRYRSRERSDEPEHARARFQRRDARREHARLLPDRLHPERLEIGDGWTAEERGDAYVRRVAEIEDRKSTRLNSS